MTVRGVVSNLSKGRGLNFFLSRGNSAPVRALKPPEIHRFHWSRGVWPQYPPPLTTPHITVNNLECLRTVATEQEREERKSMNDRFIERVNFHYFVVINFHHFILVENFYNILRFYILPLIIYNIIIKRKFSKM